MSVLVSFLIFVAIAILIVLFFFYESASYSYTAFYIENKILKFFKYIKRLFNNIKK